MQGEEVPPEVEAEEWYELEEVEDWEAEAEQAAVWHVVQGVQEAEVPVEASSSGHAVQYQLGM